MIRLRAQDGSIFEGTNIAFIKSKVASGRAKDEEGEFVCFAYIRDDRFEIFRHEDPSYVTALLDDLWAAMSDCSRADRYKEPQPADVIFDVPAWEARLEVELSQPESDEN